MSPPWAQVSRGTTACSLTAAKIKSLHRSGIAGERLKNSRVSGTVFSFKNSKLT